MNSPLGPSHSPAARVAFKAQAHDRTRLRIHSYGQDDRVPSPGDLLITSHLGDANSGLIELAVLIPGREMHAFLSAAANAVADYEENKDWLSAPVTVERVAS